MLEVFCALPAATFDDLSKLLGIASQLDPATYVPHAQSVVGHFAIILRTSVVAFFSSGALRVLGTTEIPPMLTNNLLDTSHT